MVWQVITGSILAGLLALIVFLAWRGRRRILRSAAASYGETASESFGPVSVLIPCYNDGEGAILAAEAALRACPPRSEVLILDDGSRVETRTVLRQAAAIDGVRLYRNHTNIGKVATLNRWYQKAAHDRLVFLDSDVVVSKLAIAEILAAVQLPGVVAVNAPYQPMSHAFWPVLQWIEYGMVTLVLWAYNSNSAMMLLGTCFYVDRVALRAVDGFREDAIAEDMDLGFRLYQAGGRIVTTATAIETEVPNDWRIWWRQKRRWSMGGVQALVRYWRLWIKHPIQLFFIVVYGSVTLAGLFGLTHTILFGVFYIIHMTPLEWAQLGTGIYEAGFLKTGAILLQYLAWGLAFTLFSLPYAFPFLRSWRTAWRALYVVPYAIVYVPLASAAYVWGAWVLLRKWQRNSLASRAKW